MVIDHHVSEDDLGAELFKDGEAEATGRLVLEAGEALGVRFTPEIAQPLFAAIATDTGWFRFASTGAETFRAAARLLEAGAQPDRLFKDLYETESLARLRLTGRTLARTQTELGGRLIYTWVERGDFEATGALPSDTEDLINMTLTVGGTEVALILVETKSGFKVSFRSRCELDCSRIAEQFGGGGHRRAAGRSCGNRWPPAARRFWRWCGRRWGRRGIRDSGTMRSMVVGIRKAPRLRRGGRVRSGNCGEVFGISCIA